MNTFVQFNAGTYLLDDILKNDTGKDEKQTCTDHGKNQQTNYSSRKAANYVKLIESGEVREDGQIKKDHNNDKN